MSINEEILKVGRVASQTLLYPMLPQRMTQKELEAIAGGQFGFDVLADNLYPEMVETIARYGGGRVDAAMRAKMQTWLHGWVEPPVRYVVHHPFHASGQWWRIFRTAMYVEQDLEVANDAARTLTPAELEARYAHALGIGARARYETHAKWWEDVLTTIRMGTWHAAFYSPRYKGFVSPLINDLDEPKPDTIEELRAEWPRQTFRLFSTESDEELAPGCFDLSRMIASGAFIEVLGEVIPAPPYGGNWGEGATLNRPGGTSGWLISGLVMVWTDERGDGFRRVFIVKDDPEIGGVVLDGPDPFRLAQAIFGVTGWCPKGIDKDLMAPERLGDLVEQGRTLLAGATGDAPLIVPKPVFEDAIAIHPGLVPVYGRAVSLVV